MFHAVILSEARDLRICRCRCTCIEVGPGFSIKQLQESGFSPWGKSSLTLATILQRFRNTPMIPFARDENMRRIAPLAEEFFANVLFDEEPLFVSDEATTWDVYSGSSVDELRQRCLKFYGVDLRPHDFQRSLWSLIEHLDRSRTKHASS